MFRFWWFIDKTGIKDVIRFSMENYIVYALNEGIWREEDE